MPGIGPGIATKLEAAGIYDLKVRMGLNPDITYDAVKVEAGKITEIEVIVKERK